MKGAEDEGRFGDELGAFGVGGGETAGEGGGEKERDSGGLSVVQREEPAPPRPWERTHTLTDRHISLRLIV